MISSATGSTSGGSPVFFVVDVAADLQGGLIGLEAAASQDLDDPGRLREVGLTGDLVLLRDADHLRVAAQEHVRAGRVEWLAELTFQLPGSNEVLDVDLAPRPDALAGGQRQVGVVRV